VSENWRRQALCAEIDPELWFPDKGDAGAAAIARRICHQCPVMAECREEGLAYGYRDGIWGGLSGKERDALRRDRKKAAA
jgi:WhiB family redox-sensing transcriptional regulator